MIGAGAFGVQGRAYRDASKLRVSGTISPSVSEPFENAVRPEQEEHRLRPMAFAYYSQSRLRPLH
jgi:hypothetical protein